MTGMYFLLLGATLLFAFQFLFSKLYHRSKGDGADAAFTFLMASEAVSFMFMLILSGFRLHFTWFSALLGALYAINSTLFVYFGLKALSVTNLSVYSVFAMLGGMLLPSLVGILFYHEGLTWQKAGAAVLIIAAILLTVEKGKKGGKTAFFYYIAVFFFNGMAVVLSKIHQSAPSLATDSESFVAIYNLLTVFLCFGLYLLKFRSLPTVKGREFGCAAGYALCCGVPNLMLLIAMTRLPVSVQYPIVTGGVMFFSTAISLIMREKPSRRAILAALVAFGATVIIIL